MRIQDWLADHFGFQYAVPRVNTKREPSRLRSFAAEFFRTLGPALIRALIVAFMLLELLEVRRGQTPVALLFFAALLSLGSGLMVSLLFL